MGAVFVILAITLFGGMLFALASGLLTNEQERARALRTAGARAPEDRLPEPLEDRCPTCGAPQRRPGVTDLLFQLEQRIRAETIAVARFVDDPSEESLHAVRARGEWQGARQPPLSPEEHN